MLFDRNPVTPASQDDEQSIIAFVTEKLEKFVLTFEEDVFSELWIAFHNNPQNLDRLRGELKALGYLLAARFSHLIAILGFDPDHNYHAASYQQLASYYVAKVAHAIKHDQDPFVDFGKKIHAAVDTDTPKVIADKYISDKSFCRRTRLYLDKRVLKFLGQPMATVLTFEGAVYRSRKRYISDGQIIGEEKPIQLQHCFGRASHFRTEEKYPLQRFFCDKIEESRSELPPVDSISVTALDALVTPFFTTDTDLNTLFNTPVSTLSSEGMNMLREMKYFFSPPNAALTARVDPALA